MNKIKELAIDASADHTSEWYRMHENYFAVECECDSLDAADAEFYLEFAFDKAADEGIEVDGSRTTLDAADKHFCLRNANPLNADWLRFCYSAGANTEGTLNVRGNT